MDMRMCCAMPVMVSGVVVLGLVVMSAFLGANGVKIKRVTIPSVIENGTEESVVLDCEYSLNETEKRWLMLRWLLNDRLIYQWTPPTKPQASDVLQGKLNLTYQASDDEYQMHRALQIMQPTTQLSGEYQCHVATIQDEQHMSATMIVFAPEKRLLLTQRKPSTDTVNITCRADGAYPVPKVELYHNPDNYLRKVVEGATMHVKERNGAYDVVLWKVFYDKNLEPGTVFECDLSIPNTEHYIRKSMIYYPGQVMDEDNAAGEDHLRVSFTLFVLALTFVLVGTL